jgi:RNA polymerase sigma-70 factor (ECF subfamily)
MLRDPNEAEDVVQEASLNAWTKLHTFKPDYDFRPWFLAIVVNECRQKLRSRWWREIRTPFSAAMPSPAPQDQILAGDEIRRALARLSYDHRVVIVLRYYLDLSFQEIGSALSISPQTARTRTHRALIRLRPIIDVPEELGNE